MGVSIGCERAEMSPSVWSLCFDLPYPAHKLFLKVCIFLDSCVRLNDVPGGEPAPSNWLKSVQWLGGSAREGFSVSLDAVKNPSCSVGFLKFGRSKELSGMFFVTKNVTTRAECVTGSGRSWRLRLKWD